MDAEHGDGEAGRHARSAGAEPGFSPAQPGGGADTSSTDLRAAMRVARMEDAERSRAIADLRGAEIARLDLLRDAIEPVLAAVPGEVEMFDAGLVPVPRPRLFVDMIAFVEMGHDKRLYRFVQDTRQGRLVLAESERLEVMRDAVTRYIARRLVEREKALAGVVPAPEEPEENRRAARPSWLRRAARITLRHLGVAALCVLLWVLGHALYQAGLDAPRR